MIKIFEDGRPSVSVCQGCSSVSIPAGEVRECDISGLLEMLETVPDPRKSRGKVYKLSFILAVSLVATLAGASSFRQIRDQVADMPQSLLRKLGGSWCFFRCMFGYPSERTIRRVLEAVDAAALDRVVGAWLRSVVRRMSDGVVDEVLALALDGKVLKGAWTDHNGQFTLFSALLHEEAVTIGQVQVPADTNEITQVKALLEATPVSDGEDVVVTVDAAHTQRETAEYLKGERGFDYIMTAVKGNQPNLMTAVFDRCRPLLANTPDHIVEEYDRGQLRRWETWITDATGIDFPHIQQAACIRRTTVSPTGDCLRKEYAWPITSGTAETITAADMHTRVRGHWGIENKSHYPRDVTWREDAQQIYTGSGPQVLATLRNLALGLFRINGISKIKETTEWITRDRNRALPLLVT
jgi:predicted transposase YbfD/YdcC